MKFVLEASSQLCVHSTCRLLAADLTDLALSGCLHHIPIVGKAADAGWCRSATCWFLIVICGGGVTAQWLLLRGIVTAVLLGNTCKEQPRTLVLCVFSAQFSGASLHHQCAAELDGLRGFSLGFSLVCVGRLCSHWAPDVGTSFAL